jgi:hypothetical protein
MQFINMPKEEKGCYNSGIASILRNGNSGTDYDF